MKVNSLAQQIALASLGLGTALAEEPLPRQITETMEGRVDGSTAAALAETLALEADWLNIPKACKARSIAAMPVHIGREPLSAEVASIHAELDGARA